MLNQRLSIDGSICTVKYVGKDVPVWPDEEAIGVEWDDPARGKNDGSVKGLKLFECSQPGAGSFLKRVSLDKKNVLYGTSFVDAVVERYANEMRVDEIKIGSKMGEVLGFDNHDLGQLMSVNLANNGISKAVEGDKRLRLDHVAQMDLSFNLFTSFQTILECLLLTPNVEFVSLNGNRFRVDVSEDAPIFPKVHSLCLANTLLTPEQVLRVLKHFPNLTYLVLAHNQTSMQSIDLRNTSLDRLDLSFNDLDNLTPFLFPTTLTSLYLSQNKLQNVSESTLPPSKHITTIDVSHNLLQWSDFDQLCLIYPCVDNLRVNDNPFTEEDFSSNNLSVSPIDSQVLARWHKELQVLNGRFVNHQIRSDSLIYFVNSVLQGKLAYPRNEGSNKAHFDNLVESLGITPVEAAPRVEDDFPTARQAFIKVTFTTRENQGERKETQKLNRHCSVQKMKFGVLRERGFSPLHGCSVVIDDIEVYDELKTLDFYGVGETSKVDVCIA
ncbi:Tubulin-specific chaperone E [Yarrowia sp. C11]|nr:Tubulin-specific chaperone E [Yarrowia sp. E02]KAG5369751.1 Tubulin-specific chaperone E [Yarrowia sp. C11]